jgi:transcriptional regulator with XRE-family HTH domain
MNYLAKNIVYLREKKDLTQKQISEMTGIKRNTWSNWETTAAQPSVEDIFMIAQFFDVTIDDLIKSDMQNVHPMDNSGSGKKPRKSPPKSPPNSPPNMVNESMIDYGRMPKIVTVDAMGVDNVVMVPVRARAGYLAGYEDPEYIQTLPSYRLPGLVHGTFRMFEISGPSMVPTFHDSDVIVGRYVENFLEIKDDRVYVVVTRNDGVVVKRVTNRVQRDGKLILNSDNQRHAGEYPPIVLDPEEVIEIWYGVMFFSRQMRHPGEIYNRLVDVESRLTLLEQSNKKVLPK